MMGAVDAAIQAENNPSLCHQPHNHLLFSSDMILRLLDFQQAWQWQKQESSSETSSKGTEVSGTG